MVLITPYYVVITMTFVDNLLLYKHVFGPNDKLKLKRPPRRSKDSRIRVFLYKEDSKWIHVAYVKESAEQDLYRVLDGFENYHPQYYDGLYGTGYMHYIKVPLGLYGKDI